MVEYHYSTRSNALNFILDNFLIASFD